MRSTPSDPVLLVRRGRNFSSLKGAESAAYYFGCERAVFELYLPGLAGRIALKVDLWDEAKDTEILRWAAEQGARPLHRSGRPRIAFRREHLRRDLLDGDAKSAMDIGVITEGIDESQLAEATTRVGIGICASVRSFPKNQYYTSMASCRIIVCPRGWGENCNCHCDAWISGKPVLTDRKCDSVDDRGV